MRVLKIWIMPTMLVMVMFFSGATVDNDEVHEAMKNSYEREMLRRRGRKTEQ